MNVRKPAELSVIIVAYNAAETIAACLEALERQTEQGFETVVVDSSTDGTADLVRREYPHVVVYHSEVRCYPGDARNIGIRMAKGEIIAFVDSDCVADPDWVERILAAHGGETLIIGGSVGVANPENIAGWSSFFCEFSPWLKRGTTRPMTDIPTCCLSMKRSAFERFGPFLEGSYCSDTAFNWNAVKGGHAPLFVPEIHVRHWNPSNWIGILTKQRMHGETFAIVRVREQRWSRMQAVARAMGTPLLPGVFWLRTALRAKDAPGYLGHFIRCAPHLMIALIYWSWGEGRGYWNAGAHAESDHRSAAQRAQ
jgi:glycosyltransferase involved in cell wall biosynthesis